MRFMIPFKVGLLDLFLPVLESHLILELKTHFWLYKESWGKHHNIWLALELVNDEGSDLLVMMLLVGSCLLSF